MLRMAQVAWTFEEDWRKDLAADFLHFYGILFDPFDDSDLGDLTPPQYFSLCYRITGYEGVVSARFQKEDEERKKQKAIDDGDVAALTYGNEKIKGVDFLKNRKKAVTKATKSDSLTQLASEVNENSLYGNLIDFN